MGILKLKQDLLMGQMWGRRKKGVRVKCESQVPGPLGDIYRLAGYCCTLHILFDAHHITEGGVACIRVRMNCKGFNCRSIPSSYLDFKAPDT